MGLISKIEDKLSGSSSSDSNKLEKSQYGSVGSNTVGDARNTTSGTSSNTSKLQNPISSSEGSGPTGSAIDPSTGNVHSSYAQNTSSSSGAPSSYPQNTSGYTSTSGAPSSYPQNTSGYTSTSGATDRMPGSYVNDESHIPSSTTSTSRTGPSQPYDPYSSKGQETAARAGTTSSTSRTMEDPSLSRSRDGGIMNQQTDQYGSQTSPTSGTTSSSHHYGRDAALAGGAGALGAGGVGAYEMNREKPPTQPLTSSSGQQGQYQDVSYMQQSQPGGMQDPSMAGRQDPSMAGRQDPSMSSGPGITSAGSNMPGSNTSSSAMSSDSPGFTQAKKMGGAYEAGYRDAMEHMQQEMAQLRAKGSGSGQAF